MYQPGQFPLLNDNVIMPTSLQALGLDLINYNYTSFASTAWPTANLAIYIPFVINRALTVYQVGWYNGSGAQSGTREVGVYTQAGAKVITGSATASGTSAIQRVNVTDTLIEAGQYWLAMSDSGTATLGAIAPVAPLCAALGILTQATASPLPANATFALNHTLIYIPECFIQLRTTL